MNNQIELLKEYGIKCKVTDEEIGVIPNIYLKKYQFNHVLLYDNVKALMIARNRDFSIESFVQDSLYLSEKLKKRIILIFDDLSPEDTSRLIQSNISFIGNNEMSLLFFGNRY